MNSLKPFNKRLIFSQKSVIWGSSFPFISLLFVLFLSACTQPTALEKVQEEKVLHVLTRASSVTYFEEDNGPSGFEFELTRRLAEHLGVAHRVRVADSLEEIYQIAEEGYTDLAALGTSGTAAQARGSALRFSEPLTHFTPTVVYRRGTGAPRNTEDLLQKHIVVPEHSAQAYYLEELRQEQHPDLDWQLMKDVATTELLRMVNDGEVDIAVVSSTEFAIYNTLFPGLRAAFELMPAQAIRWVFPAGTETSLIDEANAFIRQARENGTLRYLEERFYGHVQDFDYVGARTFIRHIEQRIPKYQATFQNAAQHYDLNWRLLAAIGYQESHWRPYATSPTGVRGLMMLTLTTAREMEVENRLNPDQSIWGGARYFKRLHKRLPDAIHEPHRTWMALAAYNVGYGHLMDARRITESQGFDPNIWQDVKRHLPLLKQKKWYQNTRYGYARGWEPVHYVQNIRRYFDVLVKKFPGNDSLQSAANDDSNEANGQSLATPNLNLPHAFQVMPPTL